MCANIMNRIYRSDLYIIRRRKYLRKTNNIALQLYRNVETCKHTTKSISDKRRARAYMGEYYYVHENRWSAATLYLVIVYTKNHRVYQPF